MKVLIKLAENKNSNYFSCYEKDFKSNRAVKSYITRLENKGYFVSCLIDKYEINSGYAGYDFFTGQVYSWVTI